MSTTKEFLKKPIQMKEAIILFFLLKVNSKKSYGILYGESSNSNYGYYCTTYDPDFKDVLRDRQDAVSLICIYK